MCANMTNGWWVEFDKKSYFSAILTLRKINWNRQYIACIYPYLSKYCTKDPESTNNHGPNSPVCNISVFPSPKTRDKMDNKKQLIPFLKAKNSRDMKIKIQCRHFWFYIKQFKKKLNLSLRVKFNFWKLMLWKIKNFIMINIAINHLN